MQPTYGCKKMMGMHITSDKVSYLHQLSLFQDIPEDELRDLKGQFRRVAYPRGHIFFMPNDPGDVLYILKVGRVQLYRMSPDGRKLVVALLEPITYFGHVALMGTGHHDTYAEAIEQSIVCIWGRDEVTELLTRRPEIALRFLDEMRKRLVVAEQRLTEMTFKRLPARLASLLLNLQRQSPSGEVVGYTHQHLADMLGTYRETVTEMLNTFQDAGLVTLGRKRIIVNDERLLLAEAEQNT